MNSIDNMTKCKEKCQAEDYCEAFVFTKNYADTQKCSLNTFGTSDKIVNATGKVFGFKYCKGTINDL